MSDGSALPGQAASDTHIVSPSGSGAVSVLLGPAVPEVPPFRQGATGATSAEPTPNDDSAINHAHIDVLDGNHATAIPTLNGPPEWKFPRKNWRDDAPVVLFSFVERMEITASVPLLGLCSRRVREAQKFLAARNMKRLSYRELWRRRDDGDTDMEIAIEGAILGSMWTVSCSWVMLLYSLFQLVATTVPAVFDHCEVSSTSGSSHRMPDGSVGAFVRSDGLSASDFTSFFNMTKSAMVGYEIDGGWVGVCQVPAALDAMLAHDKPLLYVAFALVIMSAFLLIASLVYSFWSGPLLVFIRALREKKDLPTLKDTKLYYRADKMVLSFETHLIFVGCVIGLGVFFFKPSITYVAVGCPVPIGYSSSSDEIDCLYRFSDYATTWTSYYAIFMSMYGIFGLNGGMKSMMRLLADPSSALPTSAILHDAAIKKEKQRQVRQQHKQPDENAKKKDDVGSPASKSLASSCDHTHAAAAAAKEEGSALDNLTDLYAHEAHRLQMKHARGSFAQRLYFCCRNRCCRRRRAPQSGMEMVAPSSSPPTMSLDAPPDFESPPESSLVTSTPSWLTDLAGDGDETDADARWPDYIKAREKRIQFEVGLKRAIAIVGLFALLWGLKALLSFLVDMGL